MRANEGASEPGPLSGGDPEGARDSSESNQCIDEGIRRAADAAYAEGVAAYRKCREEGRCEVVCFEAARDRAERAAAAAAIQLTSSLAGTALCGRIRRKVKAALSEYFPC